MNIDFLNKTILEESINKLLTDSTYKSTARKMSQIFRDRPLKPLQNAVYWIEYVIRYDGAKHMQSPAVHLNIIQKSFYDVIIALALAAYIAVFLMKFAFRYRWLQFIFLGILTYYFIRFLQSSIFTENKLW